MTTVGAFVLAVAASVPAFSACQFSPAETQVYRRAIALEVPFTERQAAFRQSIKACPDDPSLYAAFASLLIVNNDFDAALPLIDQGLRLAPADPTLTLRKGEALIALGHANEGLAALEKTPLTDESQFFRGLGYQSIEDHEHARNCFLDSWTRGKQDAFVLYSLIREDKALSDKSAGLEHFRLMLSRFPDSAWIHVLLGDAHFQKAQQVQAEQEYLQAVKLAPDLFEPNFRLAYLAFEAGQNSSAVKYYRMALAVKPHHTEANIYLGEALRRERRLPEAIEQLRRAIEVDPKSALAYDSLSKALVDAGRPAEAVVVLAAAEKVLPENSSFPGMRARVLATLGRTAEARQEAARAAAIIAHKNQKDMLVY